MPDTDKVHYQLSGVYLLSWLKKFGVKARILDLQLYKNKDAQLIKTLNSFKPDYAGISSMTAQFPRSLQIADCIRNHLPDTKIILGGPHATALPEYCASFKEFDAIVQGRGEESLQNLICGWRNIESIEDIPGVYCKSSDGRITGNSPRKFDLNKLPALDHSLVNTGRLYKLQKLNGGTYFPRVQTTTGCMKNCKYCSSNQFGFQMRDLDSVIKELIYLDKVGAEHIAFIDPDFTAVPERTEEICREIIRRKMKFTWRCYSCVDNFLKAPVDMMCKAGFKMVVWGIESGNENLRSSMGKSINDDQINKAYSLAGKHELFVNSSYIMGFYGETRESIRETVSHAIRMNADATNIYRYIAFPGTMDFKKLVDISKPVRWDLYNLTSLKSLEDPEGPPMLCDLERKEFIQLYIDALKKVRLGEERRDKKGFFGRYRKLSRKARTLVKTIVKWS